MGVKFIVTDFMFGSESNCLKKKKQEVIYNTYSFLVIYLIKLRHFANVILYDIKQPSINMQPRINFCQIIPKHILHYWCFSKFFLTAAAEQDAAVAANKKKCFSTLIFGCTELLHISWCHAPVFTWKKTCPSWITTCTILLPNVRKLYCII